MSEHFDIIIIGSGAGGGTLCQRQQIFAYRNGMVFPERVLLPGVNGLLGESGELGVVSQRNLQQHATNFVRFVEKVREKKLPRAVDKMAS